jgi:hypothetical protein
LEGVLPEEKDVDLFVGKDGGVMVDDACYNGKYRYIFDGDEDVEGRLKVWLKFEMYFCEMDAGDIGECCILCLYL